MRIDRFHMERTQSLYENEVRWNLSESGVQPLKVEELLEGEAGRSEFLATALKYPESNGSRLLRERIALFYPGATVENVLVTTGTSEANFTTLWGLLEKGDRAAVMLPSYLQAWGLARAYAGRADAYRLVEKRRGLGRRWALDVDEPAAGRHEAHPSHHGHQPQQPDRRGPDRGGDGRDRRRGAPRGWRLDRVRRGLPWRGSRGAMGRPRRSGGVTGGSS